MRVLLGRLTTKVLSATRIRLEYGLLGSPPFTAGKPADWKEFVTALHNATCNAVGATPHTSRSSIFRWNDSNDNLLRKRKSLPDGLDNRKFTRA